MALLDVETNLQKQYVDKDSTMPNGKSNGSATASLKHTLYENTPQDSKAGGDVNKNSDYLGSPRGVLKAPESGGAARPSLLRSRQARRSGYGRKTTSHRVSIHTGDRLTSDLSSSTGRQTRSQVNMPLDEESPNNGSDRSTERPATSTSSPRTPRRRSSQKRRRRQKKPAEFEVGMRSSARFRAALVAARAASHWRWRANKQAHLTLGQEAEPFLPEHMHAKKPEHSRWLWDSRRGQLHWTTILRNPVEEFYAKSLSEQQVKRRLGLFGRRYLRFPNEATWAPVENGRGIFSRARSSVQDRDPGSCPNTTAVTIADVKKVAEAAVGQFFPAAYGRRRYSNIGGMDQFLLSIVEYFHHYFQDRKLVELAKQNNCLVFDAAGRASRQRRMQECQLEAARCYAKFILGQNVPFHHTDGGAFGTISASAADKQFWEALYAFTTQAVWITFGRPVVAVIVRELGRLLRSLYFDPTRRASGATQQAQTASNPTRRNAALGMKPPRSRRRGTASGTKKLDSSRFAHATRVASQNYLSMCVAMERVYGVYDCPPMPPKPIYGLLNNHSTLASLLLSEDPNNKAAGQHVTDRGNIGILGHPRNLFDDNLDPIDVPREHKFRKLKFLGPITEKAQYTRITNVTPYLLQPTPPTVDDIEKFK